MSGHSMVFAVLLPVKLFSTEEVSPVFCVFFLLEGVSMLIVLKKADAYLHMLIDLFLNKD